MAHPTFKLALSLSRVLSSSSAMAFCVDSSIWRWAPRFSKKFRGFSAPAPHTRAGSRFNVPFAWKQLLLFRIRLFRICKMLPGGLQLTGIFVVTGVILILVAFNSPNQTDALLAPIFKSVLNFQASLFFI